MLEQILRGPLLIPAENGSVAFHPDGALAVDATGMLSFAGPFAELSAERCEHPIQQSRGIMLPPLLDIHTHIPQHPVRGRFVEGVDDTAPHGKLLAGLNRNVFPAEAKCSDEKVAEKVVRDFLADTLSHGVVGGAAYMTVSTAATEIALSILPESWSVGLVLMNQNCPENLRTDEVHLDADIRRLANRFGRRLIVTDRFAVAVSTPLRRRAARLAREFALRTQTHLNEQIAEKKFVENQLYPAFASYTDVYLKDGLLDHQCIAAHCIQMTPTEWKILAETGSVIAHCPSSNLLLGSGVMPLDQVIDHQIPCALATDVGASPTVSMLAEMRRFLIVHQGRTTRATAAEALCRSTIIPSQLLGLSSSLCRLAPGMPMSFIEVASTGISTDVSADTAICSILPPDPDKPFPSVNRVTLAGKVVYQRSGLDA